MKTIHRTSHDEKSRKLRSQIVYTSCTILGIALVVYLFFALSTLILPIITGVFLAYVFRPLMNAKPLLMIPSSFRAIIVLFTITGAIGFIAHSVSKQIPSDSESLVLQVRIQYKLNEKFQSMMGISKDSPKGNFLYQFLGNEIDPVLKSINEALELDKNDKGKFLALTSKFNYSNPIPDKYYNYYLENIKRHKAEEIKQELDEQENNEFDKAVVAVATPQNQQKSLIGVILSSLTTWIVAPLLFIFLLFDKGQVLKWLVRMVPNRYFELSLTVINQVDLAIGKYLRGTLLQCSLVGLTLSIGFYLVGIDFNMAILIGMLAGMANAIPFLGPFLGLIAGLSFALIAEDVSPVLPFLTQEHLFIAVLVVVGIAQLLDNAIFQPVVLGGAVNSL